MGKDRDGLFKDVLDDGTTEVCPRIDPALKDDAMDVGDLTIAQEDVFRVILVE